MSEEIIKKQTVCDVINYKKDIEPFPLIKLYAGVGSGKSYFASSLITGSKEYNIPKQNVLIITSRRAKVNETLKELGSSVSETITLNGNLNYEVWLTGDSDPYEYRENRRVIKYKVKNIDYELEYTLYNKSVVCTNAFVSNYLRYIHNPEDPITHIWNKFDIIIVDEVHSLITDSTYQTATFDVLALIQEYLNQYKRNNLQECACKHMILMTGTPQPFNACIDLDFPKELTNELDLFDKCENVVPQNVILIDDQTAKGKIRNLLYEKQKVIYFSNHTMSESSVREKFGLTDSINIGVSFSNIEKRAKLTSEEQQKINNIDNQLAENSKLPDDIQFFVTTSKNKEGINIHNTDYNNMFIETHLMYDAVQMVGRIRSGVKNLYIITDANQLDDNYSSIDIDFSKECLGLNENSTDIINNYFIQKTDPRKSYEERKENIIKFAEYIENRFSYIRYNVYNQRFEFYNVKKDSEYMAKTQRGAMKSAILSDKDNYIKLWFKNSNILKEVSAKKQANEYLKKVIGSDLRIKLEKNDLKKHISHVRELLGLNVKSYNIILNEVDELFHCIPSNGKYILYYGTEDPIIKKKPMGKRLNP